MTSRSLKKKKYGKIPGNSRRKIKIKKSSSTEELEDKWNIVKDSITETAESIVQFTQGPKKNKWFNERCRQGIQKRNNVRIKAIWVPTPENIREFEIKRKEVSRLIRKEKIMSEKARIEEIERCKYNPREFFKRCKVIKTGFIPPILSLVDESGFLISGSEIIVNKFKDYCKELLNKVPDNDSNDEETRAYYTIDQEVLAPSLDETKAAIHTLKNNKASGEDRINSDFWKIGSQKVERELHSVILQIWDEERFPKSWNETLICPISQKKRSRESKKLQGDKYGRNTGYKVLSLIILKRLERYTEEAVGEYQSGFRKGRSTTDHIFVVR